MKSQRNYLNLRGKIGFQAIKNMFGGSDGTKDGIKYKMVKHAYYDIADKNDLKVLESVERNT